MSDTAGDIGAVKTAKRVTHAGASRSHLAKSELEPARRTLTYQSRGAGSASDALASHAERHTHRLTAYWKGEPRSRDESNFLPSVKVPV